MSEPGNEPGGFSNESVLNTAGRLVLLDISLPREEGGQSFSAWLVRDVGKGIVFLVDTGSSSGVSCLARSLRSEGITHLNFILLTHVHLDHAGGAGMLLHEFPGAKIYCHPRGRRHLVDPEKLWHSTLQVMGPAAGAEPRPISVDPESFLPETFSLPGLTILETPGHASHHSSFLYEMDGERILFPGEAAGTFRRGGNGEAYSRPASPPPFFLASALESVEKLKRTDPSLICFPHYGSIRNPEAFLEKSAQQLRLWKKVVDRGLSEGQSEGEILEHLLAEDPCLGNFPLLEALVQNREAEHLAICLKGFIGSMSPA